MKRFLLLIGVLVLPLFVMAENKKVALLQTLNGDKAIKVEGIEMNMVRGELRKAISNQEGYQAFTRTDIDQLMKEYGFQNSGMVSDAQRKRLGQMSGADYICVSTLTKSNTQFYLEAYLIDVSTEEISNPASQFGILQDGTYANLFQLCQNLAKELINDVGILSSQTNEDTPIKGEITYDGGHYVGELLNGTPHGQGTLYFASNDEAERLSYEGGWKNGVRHGIGILIWKDGSKYIGNFYDDTSSGQGTFYFADGSKYDGNWKNGQYHGQGTLYFEDGRKTDGNWENGQLNGGVMMDFGDGSRYEGIYKNGEKHGEGTEFYANGNWEQCHYQNDVKEGPATFYNKELKSYAKGIYVNGNKEGKWFVRDINGTLIDTFIFRKGEVVIEGNE